MGDAPPGREQPVETRGNAGWHAGLGGPASKGLRPRRGSGPRPISLLAEQKPTKATTGVRPERAIGRIGTEIRPRLLREIGTEIRPRLLREAAAKNIPQWAKA